MKREDILNALAFLLMMLAIGMLGPIEWGAHIWPCFIRSGICLLAAGALIWVNRECKMRDEEEAMYAEFGWTEKR